MSALLDAAHRLTALGWHLLLLKPRGKAPLGALFPHGVNDATNDPAKIERLIRRAPRDTNIAVARDLSRIVAIDVDTRNGGDDHFHELERTLGPLPDTPRVLTPGGGFHVYVRRP